MMKQLGRLLSPAALRRRWRKQPHRAALHCPFCSADGPAWQPMGFAMPLFETTHVVGAGPRLAACPGCSSTDRERLVLAYLQFEHEPASAARVLHIAPEPRLASVLRPRFADGYVQGDLFVDGYGYDESVQQMDLCELPFEVDAFDLLICNHVLEHVSDDARALREIARVLRPGGTAILQVPLAIHANEIDEDTSLPTNEAREERFGQWDHVRLYSPAGLKTRIERAGMDARLRTPDQLAWHDTVREWGLNPDEPLITAHVPDPK